MTRRTVALAAAASAQAPRHGASAATQSELEALRQSLLRALTSTIADTVDTICEEHEESFSRMAATRPPTAARSASTAPPTGATENGATATAAVEYDLYYTCCQRLVAYIAANMETSPDFVQQMDRIILACHSNASERVLRSVVTKSLWFHRRADQESDDDDDDDDDDDGLRKARRTHRAHPPPPSPASPQRTVINATMKPSPSPVPRSTKRRVPTGPKGNGTKRATPVELVVAPAHSKRQRREHAARRVMYREDSEEDEDEDMGVENRAPRRHQNRIHDDSDEEAPEDEQDGDSDVVYVDQEAAAAAARKKAKKNQPHYGHEADELLTFKDAIGDMCYPDRRSTAQTRFFKERLRKAIQFVDAQLCKPPPGKVCVWDCRKIRRQMCNRDLPCKNKICRMWHDVEAHTDRCHNSHCEFRIRVMLRETMHKIDHKKLEMDTLHDQLERKKEELAGLPHDAMTHKDRQLERRLEKDIGQLENAIEDTDKEMGLFKATKKAYWATLNEVGITPEDDVADNFPEYKAHYGSKKNAAKKKTPVKAARESDEHVDYRHTPPMSVRSERARRRQSPAQLTAAQVDGHQRITRRSTQLSVQAMTSGVIELDDDDDDEEEDDGDRAEDKGAVSTEEAKTDQSDGDDRNDYSYRPPVDDGKESNKTSRAEHADVKIIPKEDDNMEVEPRSEAIDRIDHAGNDEATEREGPTAHDADHKTTDDVEVREEATHDDDSEATHHHDEVVLQGIEQERTTAPIVVEEQSADYVVDDSELSNRVDDRNANTQALGASEKSLNADEPVARYDGSAPASPVEGTTHSTFNPLTAFNAALDQATASSANDSNSESKVSRS